MRTTGFLQRAELPAEAAAVAEQLYAAARQHERPGMISHLDAAPKNVLLTADGAALLDFELGAAVSDPAYDPGFLAGHYLLIGENLPQMTAASHAAAKDLAHAYQQSAPGIDPAWETRFWRYAALTMLYRLHGSSPAPYLAPPRYPAIRNAAIALLLRPEASHPERSEGSRGAR
jgi:Ser/Thr protein kinase RdoA (MazF antagonist)